MKRESQGVTVMELQKSGMKTADIVKMTGYRKGTIYDAVKRYKKTDGTTGRPRSGRPITATTSEIINKVP